MSEVAAANQPSPSIPVTSPQKAKGPRGQVTIFGLWCKGCKICVEFCPTDVLAFDGVHDQPVVVAPEKCTACHWCDTHCPDFAIVVKNLY